MKALFYSVGPTICPASRYRIFNFISKYEDNGISCKIYNFRGEFYYKRLIRKRSFATKLFLLVIYHPICIFKRLLSVFCVPFYDLVIIQRDFCPGVPPIGEYIIAKLFNRKIIIDFDDAVYLSSKPAGKTEKVMQWATGVIAGNKVLANYASRFCTKVITVPTSIDSASYNSIAQKVNKNNTSIVIGWIGSFSTLIYLDIIKNVFQKLERVYNIKLHVICNARLNWDNNSNINNINWEQDTYLIELCKFDIGIMPLLDGEWEQGKCGFKIIQYMGVGIPVVASPVGVNKDLIQNTINGYLASTEEDWFTCLESLICNADLRQKMGSHGKHLAESLYSIESNAPVLIQFFRDICKIE